MRIQYEGRDVTADVHIKSAQLMDYEGGRCDRAELRFVDPGRMWLRWGAKKGDTLQVSEGPCDTGKMWVDEIGYEAGVFRLGAVPVPPAMRQPETRAYERVRLSTLIAEVAERAGLKFALYGQEDDPLYERVEQDAESGIAFLARRCALERRAVKVVDGTIAVIFEPWAEARDPVREIALLDSTRFNAYSTSAGVYSGCRVLSRHGGEFHVPGKLGPVYTINAAKGGIGSVGSAEEAHRFAMGVLRGKNRWEHRMDLEIPLDTELASGSVVTARIEGAWGGEWIAGAVRHELPRGRTSLSLRRPLEGC